MASGCMRSLTVRQSKLFGGNTTEADKKFFKDMLRQYYPDEFARLHPDEAEAEKQSEKYILNMSKSELKKRAKELKIKWFSAMDNEQLLEALFLKANGEEEKLNSLSDLVRQKFTSKIKDRFKK